MATTRTIWTIGYEGHIPESFVEALRKAKVERVIDVRELPLSRRSGFSKHALALGLKAAGIEYSHVKALGTPRAIRHAYKAGGTVSAFQKAYGEHLEAQGHAMRELIEVASRERCCLMCLEHDAEQCHRRVIADALVARGWRVKDL